MKSTRCTTGSHQLETVEEEKNTDDNLQINLIVYVWHRLIWEKIYAPNLSWLFFQFILLRLLAQITAYPFTETLISCLSEICPLWSEILSWLSQQTSCSVLEGRFHTWQFCSRILQYMPVRIIERNDKLPLNYKMREIVKTGSLRSLFRRQETVLEAKRKIWVSRKY